MIGSFTIHNSLFTIHNSNDCKILSHLQQRATRRRANQRQSIGRRHHLPRLLPAHLRQSPDHCTLALAQQRRTRRCQGVQNLCSQLQAPRLGQIQPRMDHLNLRFWIYDLRSWWLWAGKIKPTAILLLLGVRLYIWANQLFEQLQDFTWFCMAAKLLFGVN